LQKEEQDVHSFVPSYLRLAEVEKKRDPSHERALKKTEWITLLERNSLQMQSCLTLERLQEIYLFNVKLFLHTNNAISV
ncbi:hypothetical protein ACT453_23105, partial [Bacillus sp. D-CC]